MTDDDGATSSAAILRESMRALTDPDQLMLNLLLVNGHRTPGPTVYDVPVSVALARQLLEQVAETAAGAAEAELRPVVPGFVPSAQQWVHSELPPGPLADIDAVVLRPTHRQYDSDVEFGQRNLLVLRVVAADGRDLARVYQGFSPDKTLARGKRILAFWNGEQFSALDAEQLVIDRTLRLFAVDGRMVMKSNSAYESLFGALPDLRVRAAATYNATLGKLDIVGGDELRAACESDLNMMRKLLSIAHKMEQPGYPDALDMPSVLAFLERNPHIGVPIDRSAEYAALVFQPQAQHRWALLKLLDDDFLRSDLTNINYEANSKTEVPG